MQNIKFNKPQYVQRLKKLIRREKIKVSKLIAMTEYKKSTFYRHTNLSLPDEPSLTDLLRLSYVLNTSLDYLMSGKGAEKIAHLQKDDFYSTMSRLYDKDKEAYGILVKIIMSLEYSKVETITDVALAYGVETGLF